MMKLDACAKRAAYIVNKALQSYFPEDYQARCMYAAYGTQSVLQTMGYQSRIVAGSFGIFSLARDGSRVTFDIWGGNDTGVSHFWCVVNGRILDPTSPFMSHKGAFPKYPAPIVYWDATKPMPRCFRYTYACDLDPRSIEKHDAGMKKRRAEFVALCDEKLQRTKGQPRMKSWLLKDMSSLRIAARSGDGWAAGALKLEEMPGNDQLKLILLQDGSQESIPV